MGWPQREHCETPRAAKTERLPYGREGAVHRQHLPGAAVADGEVRRDVPESLRRRQGGPERTSRLPPVLRRPEAPSGPGLPNPGRSVPRSHECSGVRLEAKQVSTAIGAGIIGTLSRTLA